MSSTKKIVLALGGFAIVGAAVYSNLDSLVYREGSHLSYEKEKLIESLEGYRKKCGRYPLTKEGLDQALSKECSGRSRKNKNSFSSFDYASDGENYRLEVKDP